MRIQFRSLTIDLADDDARVGVIQAVLFGQPLPPPLPLPVEPPPPAPPKPPPLESVPRALRNFWDALEPPHRRELALLAERAYPAAELESVLGVDARALGGRHSLINRRVAEHDVTAWVRNRGRGRAGRRYYVGADVAGHLRVLAAHTRESTGSVLVN